jgi:chondroitin synthase
MYLKLSEVGPFKHVNKIAYNRVLHGENTSIRKLGIQKQNHFRVINNSLARQGIVDTQIIAANEQDEACRKYVFRQSASDGTVDGLTSTCAVVGLKA